MHRPWSRVRSVRVSGPLAPHVAAFASKLREAGYTPLSAVHQMHLLAHLSRWLGGKGLGVAGLTESRSSWRPVALRATRG